jgi:DNA-binding MarR family transcriptional regulator
MEAYDVFHRQMLALHAPELLELNLTLAQLKAVYLVVATGPIRMSALAVQLGTAISTTSGVVDRLVHAGVLARSEDPADRRQVLVAATPTAVRQLEEVSELGRDRMRELLDRLPTINDIETVERAVRLLADAAAGAHEDTDA